MVKLNKVVDIQGAYPIGRDIGVESRGGICPPVTEFFIHSCQHPWGYEKPGMAARSRDLSYPTFDEDTVRLGRPSEHD